MKKFLSLVMALVMTMSLVTIGAGATEYKDLTDKSEIQYEEAVAVLNKLGIISGYEDGSFRPTGALTRGAAAKIIVSLMIGPEAANALTVNTAPYSDVPVTNTFAAVISYCKTAGYINGYTDGTFRPAAALTGYAFTKMLLGALGYDGVQENFTGEGWIMNVSRLGNAAGLFNDFNTAFKGNDGVDRESACLLALNTLKATQVEYSGGTSITTSTGDATTSVNTQKVRSYKVSNNTNINRNINSQTSANNANYLTLEFGEEHFQDLVLDNEKYGNFYEDSYGRPSNQWSLKNVKIGTYAKTANYTYTEGPSGDTNVDKVKSMGLKDYKFDSSHLTVNGESRDGELTNGSTTLAANAATLAKYAKNGALVQVYLDKDDANVISHIAVTETQIMQVNRVSTGDVTLKKAEDQGVATSSRAVNVNPVEDDDVLYDVLKDLKSDDYVVVTPLWNSNGTWDVDGVFVPTTATGNITQVKVNSYDNNTSGLTVADTEYKMSKNWTAEDAGTERTSALNGTSVTTRQESTVYLDSYGYAIFVSNVKASTSYFMFDEFYANTVNGRIHYFAQGWDTKGNEVALDLGTSQPNLTAGKVYAYKVASSNANADYQIDTAKTNTNVVPKTSAILASDTGLDGYYFTSGVKFVFPTWENGEITGATVKDGAQKVTSSTYQYVLNNDTPAKIIAVFLADDKDVEVSQNVMFVEKQTAVRQDADGKDVSVFTAYIDGVKQTGLVANKKVSDNTFYTYAVNESTGIYTVNAYSSMTGKATSVITGANLARTNIKSNAYVDSGSLILSDGTGLAKNLNLSNTTVIDLRSGGTISSAKDMFEGKINNVDINNYDVSLVYNDSNSSSNQGRVAYLFILNAYTSAATKFGVTAPANTLVSLNGANWSNSVQAAEDATVYIKGDVDGAIASEVTITSGSVSLTESNGVYTFKMPARAVNSGDFSATVNAVTKGQLSYTGKEIVMEYIGTLSAELRREAITNILNAAGGYSNITFTNDSATSNVEFVKGNVQGEILNANILADTAASGNIITVKVNGASYLAKATASTVEQITGIASNAASFTKVTSPDGTVAYVATNAGAVAQADAGKDYSSDEYVVFNAATKSGSGNAAYDVSYVIDGAAVAAAPSHIKVGANLQIVLTANAAVTNTSAVATAASVTFDAAGTGNVTFSGDAAKVASASTAALTFVSTNDLPLVAIGDKVISGVYTPATQTAFVAIDAAIVAPAN